MSGIELLIITSASLLIVIGGAIKTMHKMKCCGMYCERELSKTEDTQQTSFIQSVINKLTPRRSKTPRKTDTKAEVASSVEMETQKQ